MFIDLEVEDVVESSAWWVIGARRGIIVTIAGPRAERLIIIGHGKAAGSPSDDAECSRGVPS